MATQGKIRILLSRDDWAHSRGYYVIAQGLRDAGMEVILGDMQIPRAIAATAIQEDVDIIGYRIMSGSPTVLVSKLLNLLEQEGRKIPVVVGGIIPPEEIIELKKLGAVEAFLPGATIASIVDFIQDTCCEKA